MSCSVIQSRKIESMAIEDGGRDEYVEEREQPAWFTPERMLLILCMINLLNYIDRGAIASNGVNGTLGNSTCSGEDDCFEGRGIQGDFSLSNFQDGVLASAFMLGLLISSPIFAELSKNYNHMRLIGVGLSVWTAATLGCGLSLGFWSIAFFRALVGVAEASFISLAAPFIDDYAPPESRTAWLSYFYACIPVGVALGYVYGGVVGGSLGWRAAFILESLLMLPFAIFGFVTKPVYLKTKRDDTNSKALLEKADYPTLGDEESSSIWKSPVKTWNLIVKQGSGIGEDLKLLFKEPIYVVDVLGYVAYNFVIGAYAYFGPKVGAAIYHMENPDILFGGSTILAGISGTLCGGLVLDKIGSTVPNAFRFLGISSFVGAVLCFTAFTFSTLLPFIILFTLGDFFLFATQGPVNFITLHSVHPNNRPIALAMCTVLIHILGDVPSAPLIGLLQDYLQNWRTSSLILTSVLFPCSIIWYSGSYLPAKDAPLADEPRSSLESNKPRATLLPGQE
ncbi:hypothetical protein R1sor_013923 [Riccia sorocarpa]|uniref:Major facilitator superfamily (MFS) profile domain-containing protein n=1 Tax=Riccia sorocarpa TaxID=122646 RepID=A0ABD3HAT8_9MARC